jgi:hypothetical protein
MLIYINNRVADYRDVFLNTSFPETGPDENFLRESCALKVRAFKPFDINTERLVACEPYIEDEWAYIVKVEKIPLEDLDVDTKRLEFQARNLRNTLLSESDWTQLEDSQINKEQWATYRQSLRNITNQSTFPHEIMWPDKP